MKEYGDNMLILAQQMEKDLKEPPLHQPSPQPEPKRYVFIVDKIYQYLIIIKVIKIMIPLLLAWEWSNS